MIYRDTAPFFLLRGFVDPGYHLRNTALQGPFNSISDAVAEINTLGSWDLIQSEGYWREYKSKDGSGRAFIGNPYMMFQKLTLVSFKVKHGHMPRGWKEGETGRPKLYILRSKKT